MSALKQVIAERCTKMMAVGLRNKPFHRNEQEFQAMLEVWHDAITHAGYSDKDAPMVGKAWNELMRTSEDWFYPKNLIANIKICVELEEYKTPALPDMSDEQRAINLQRIQKMTAVAFSSKAGG